LNYLEAKKKKKRKRKRKRKRKGDYCIHTIRRKE